MGFSPLPASHPFLIRAKGLPALRRKRQRQHVGRGGILPLQSVSCPGHPRYRTFHRGADGRADGGIDGLRTPPKPRQQHRPMGMETYRPRIARQRTIRSYRARTSPPLRGSRGGGWRPPPGWLRLSGQQHRTAHMLSRPDALRISRINRRERSNSRQGGVLSPLPRRFIPLLPKVSFRTQEKPPPRDWWGRLEVLSTGYARLPGGALPLAPTQGIGYDTPVTWPGTPPGSFYLD